MKRFLVCLLLLGCTMAGAADRLRYVDTGAVGAGTGKDWDNAYTSLQAAIVAEVAADADLTGEGRLYFYLRRTGAGGEDTTSAVLDGFTCPDIDHSVWIIQTDLPTDGVYDGTTYVLQNNDVGTALLIQDEFTCVDGLHILVSSTAGNARYGLVVNTVATCTMRFNRLILQGGTWGTGSGTGLYLNDNSLTAYVTNCTATKFFVTGDTGFVGFRNQITSSTGFFNCVSYGNTVGIQQVAGTVTATNCAVGNNEDDWSGTITIDYCCDDDADEQAHGSSPSGGNWALEFADPANGNFTLLATATGCVNTGAADPGGADQPDMDIIGTARPQGVAWDIGAYEYIQPSGGTVFDPGFDVGFRNGGFED